MTWFETLTGVAEESPDQVRQHLYVDGDRLFSRTNKRNWRCGVLETPTLSELRKRVQAADYPQSPVTVREVVANVHDLHTDVQNTNAMFQVASQFNLLEMIGPATVPEDGVGIYEDDGTQGPACAIACGAGTIFRNYFVDVDGETGQTSQNQIDCLKDIGARIGNSDQQLWKMENGYALPSRAGLEEVDALLGKLNETELDQIRGLLRIGIHRDTQVTIEGANHLVSQCYCSAMPVGYSGLSSASWARFATLILEASYEATLCASIENAARTGNRKIFLTLLGGGVFGNKMPWIVDSITRAIALHANSGLEISIVSFSQSTPAISELIRTLPHE